MRDAIELRGVLEGTAARFAAERGAPAPRAARAAARSTRRSQRLVHRADYESFERYVRPQRALPRPAAQAGPQPAAGARARRDRLAAVRRARARSCWPRPSCPTSREILVIAHRHHVGLIEAIERRQGARAESLAREHARLALTNLEIVLRHRDGARPRCPGGSLIALRRPTEARACRCSGEPVERAPLTGCAVPTAAGSSHPIALRAPAPRGTSRSRRAGRRPRAAG